MKIEKYEILSAINKTDLSETVNKWIKMGWCPFGGVSSDGNRLYQAMVKYEEKKKSCE